MTHDRAKIEALIVRLERFGRNDWGPITELCRNAEEAMRELLADAERYQCILDDPEGARHLLLLLQQGKGDKAAFSNMIDRIKSSKQATIANIAAIAGQQEGKPSE